MDRQQVAARVAVAQENDFDATAHGRLDVIADAVDGLLERLIIAVHQIEARCVRVCRRGQDLAQLAL